MYRNIFDTHAHYDDARFSEDLHETIERIFSSGVSAVINCSCTVKSSEKSLELAGRYPGRFFAAVGIHPLDIEDEGLEALKETQRLCDDPACVAIGEIGLDYHYSVETKELQLKAFEEQLLLANKKGLPVIVHDREAHADCAELMMKHRPRGVMHCFSGSVESAREYVKAGLYIGIGGSVTFKNAVKPKEVAAAIPLDRLLLETDCPYMAPVPHRGERNDSALISFVAEEIARLRGMEPQQVIDAAEENARRLFGIK